MDGEAFKVWLSAIGDLTDEQRGAGFRALALAEAGWCEPVAADAVIPAYAASASAALAEAGWCEPVAADAVIPAYAASASAALAAPGPGLPGSAPVTAAAARRVEVTGCPHCGGRSLQGWGQSHGLPRHRCNGCRRSFNGLTGTPLARPGKKDRWAAQAEAMLAGESLAKAAKRCGVAVSTAFRWRHRFL